MENIRNCVHNRSYTAPELTALKKINEFYVSWDHYNEFKELRPSKLQQEGRPVPFGARPTQGGDSASPMASATACKVQPWQPWGWLAGRLAGETVLRLSSEAVGFIERLQLAALAALGAGWLARTFCG